MQRTSSSLRYMNWGPGHMQCSYSSAYSDFNIQLKVSALLMDISRQFNESSTEIWVPNTAHNRQFAQCVLSTRTHTKYVQYRIFRPQYSTERICAATGDMATIQCGLYYKLCAKCSAHPPVFAMWTVILDIYNVFTAPHIQAWTYLRCNWRYHDNSVSVIQQIWCQI
jgi:hypothetical protein